MIALGRRHALQNCLAIWAALVLAPALWPQNVSNVGNNAPPVRLQLRVTTSATKFHLGELIPLELSYISDTDKRYQIETTLQHFPYGESPVRFVVTPLQGTHDPEKAYWDSMAGGGWAGDILTGLGLLSRTPTFVPAILNESVVIDRPGLYRLYAISHQVSDVSVSSQPVPLTINSNVIQFEVLAADPAWERAELQHIREVLDHVSPSDAFVPGTPMADAVKALRFLTGEDAAREMARHLCRGTSASDFEYMLGLLDSAQRAAARGEMQKLLADPDFPVCGSFVDTFTRLALSRDTAPDEVPSRMADSRQALQGKLLDLLATKRGRALAVSLDTLLNSGVPPSERPVLLKELLRSFQQLPIESQTNWLQYQWSELKSPDWLPILRTIATRYQDFPEPREMTAWQSLQLSGAALKDWYEIDPEDARAAVVTEINRARPRYNATVLGLLPDPTLPDSEGLLAANFVASDNYEIEGNLASLLHRYADESVLPAVLPKIEENVGRWACEPQDNILALVLKVEPDTAKPLVERALAARGPDSSGCRHMVLTDVARLQPSPSLEEIALPALDDPDPQVAMNAAEYLGEYGSAAVEDALWQHYQAWSQGWTGHADELRVIPGSDNPDQWEDNRGASLANALATGVAWLADDKTLLRIAALDVTGNMKVQLESEAAVWQQRPITIAAVPSRPLSFILAQYNLRSLDELKTKLAEFPRGTAFTWSADESPEAQAAFEEISAVARKCGLVLKLAAPN